MQRLCLDETLSWFRVAWFRLTWLHLMKIRSAMPKSRTLKMTGWILAKNAELSPCLAVRARGILVILTTVSGIEHSYPDLMWYKRFPREGQR